MSVTEHLPDGSLVTEIANLKHPEAEVHSIYRQKVLTIGQEHINYDDPSLPEPTALKVSTLQAVVDYVRAKLADMPVIITVASPTRVEIVAPLVGDQRQLFTYLVAAPVLPEIFIRQYLDMESFLIQLQSCFVPTETRATLQQFCSKTRAGLAREIEDDGVSQTVTVLSGVTRTEDVPVNNPWFLAPYRTFPEIDQPESAYLLRMKGKPSGDSIAANAELREADGGKWRCEAITRIGAWLRAQLGEDAIILA